MNQRLQQFIAAENLSQSQFADALGVARASVSHILAGRNKPGFDFIESMSRHYPSLNLEWLITGKGKMYKSLIASPAAATPPVSNTKSEVNLFSTPEPNTENIPSPAPSTAPVPPPASISAPAPAPAPAPASAASNVTGSKKERSQAGGTSRNIEKIIVFYDDGSFQELK